MADTLEISLGEIAQLKAKMNAARAKKNPKDGSGSGSISVVAERRAAETAGMRAQDGRIRMATSDTGLVQLNVRVTPDLKNQIIHHARTTGSDMGSVVEAALKLFLGSSSARS
jgi:hypothetical protein